MLWAGTQSGDVLVFHTRYKLKSGGSQTECKCKSLRKNGHFERKHTALTYAVQHRISPEPDNSAPAIVRSLRGHVVVANGDLIRVFNSSRVQREPPHLLARDVKGNHSDGHALLATAIGPTGSEQESEMRVGYYSPGSSTLHGYEALLSTKREANSDFNWFRIPMYVLEELPIACLCRF